MTEYIRVAFCNSSSIKYIPIEQNGKVLMETFRSLFSEASGMFFELKNKQFIITLHNSYFHPPAQGWQDTVYYPLYDDLQDEIDQDDYIGQDEQDDHDDYVDDQCDDLDEDDDNYDEYDDDYHDPQQGDTELEDINKIIFRMMKQDKEKTYDTDDDE